MAHNFCCAHPQGRIDTPEPPSRPPISIDGIFAAAALPEDHPHALKFPDKKPEVATSIIRSPGIATKIKSQLRRKSVKALRSSDAYDVDARAMSSSEVVNDATALGRTFEEPRRVVSQYRFGSAMSLHTPAGRELPEDPRASLLKSLDWLKPLLDRPSDLTQTGSAIVADSPAATATSMLDGAQNTEPECHRGMPQSLSSPNPLHGDRTVGTPLRRTKSFLGLHTLLAAPNQGSAKDVQTSNGIESSTTVSNSLLHLDGTHSGDIADVRPSADTGGTRGCVKSGENEAAECSDNALSAKQERDIHLHTMGISQQLRSLSALSEAMEDDIESFLPPRYDPSPWNFHRRERSDIGQQSVRTHHSRHQSCPGRCSAELCPGPRVKSPAPSSIYSRPASTADAATKDRRARLTAMLPYETAFGLAGAPPEWPLGPEQATEVLLDGLRASQPGCDTSSQHTTRMPASVLDTGDSTSASFVTAPNLEPLSSPWLSSNQRSTSIPSKDSSSRFTASSKRTRFHERFSPLKKTVMKRRSIFKFLRPGSRKQPRSVSTPVLRPKASIAGGMYDGPAEDNELLTVQYEMTDNPQQFARSASVSQLSPQRRDTASGLAIPGLPQRRPSMADYERVLTATGDDRRKPSAINLQRLQEIQEDDHRQSLHVMRNISRAKPLSDEPTGLMEQALEKHQQEKALFRSASKQKEMLAARHDATPPPIFRTDTLTAAGTSLRPPSPAAPSDLLDPLERRGSKVAAGRSHSASYLLPTPSVSGTPSQPTTTAASLQPGSRRVSSTAIVHQTPHQRRGTNKIGTSLSAWSRYPSHTRAERCGPAGPHDDVVARDFALATEPPDNASLVALEAASPISKKSAASKASDKSKAPLTKSRSTTFSNLVRYYSNVFTTGGATAQNRRSSVATGGWLTNPDLELLPPATSNEPTFPHHDHHFKQHLHQLEHDLEAQVRKDIGYVEAEATKFEKAVVKDVEVVEEGAEKLLHLHPHHQHNSSPFHEGSPFGRSAEHYLHRDSTFIDPLDESPEQDPTPGAQDSKIDEQQAHSYLALDGAATPKTALSSSSKAEAWSSLYQECMPWSSPVNAERTPLLSRGENMQQAMGPPALKPAKTRSPEQSKGVDPNASIRRFPSVTVVDDRKGHSRSISLISVKCGPDGICRSSTNDLLQLIQAREQEEREKLLRGPSRASSVIMDDQR